MVRISYRIAGDEYSAAWWSANNLPTPAKVVSVDDRLTADEAVKYASQGIAMLWLGDFNNARQLLSAIDRRVTRKNETAQRSHRSFGAEEFYRIRQARAGRSRMMSLLLVPLERDGVTGDMELPLPRAPQVGEAVAFGYGELVTTGEQRAAVSLQELIGVRSAYQWFVTGVDVPSLGAKIHPQYGTFLPTRHEYVDLVVQAPITQSTDLAFDIGTGTGVLSAVLVRRGVPRVIGTDIHQRAIDCANDNFARLGIADSAHARLTDMFPEGRASLIVCNPPWLPGKAASTLDAAVYDPGSKILLQFLAGLADHLTETGEGWLILSDLAEHLGLRSRQMLLDAIAQAGLEVVDRLDTVPTHRKVSDSTDILHSARAREVTSLWRLRCRQP